MNGLRATGRVAKKTAPNELF